MTEKKAMKVGFELSDREMLDLFETACRNGGHENTIEVLRENVLGRMTAGTIRLGVVGRPEMVRYGKGARQ